jgi:hypothetical protein
MTARICATCNAPHNNTVERIVRCGTCYAKPAGNTKWAPITITGEKP